MNALEKYLETITNPLIVVGVDYGNIEIIDQPLTAEYLQGLCPHGKLNETCLGTKYGTIYCFDYSLTEGQPINMNMLPFFFTGTVIISGVGSQTRFLQRYVKKEFINNIVHWIYDNDK